MRRPTFEARPAPLRPRARPPAAPPAAPNHRRARLAGALVFLCAAAGPAQAQVAGAAPAGSETLLELLLAGGPLMIPIALCSVVALATWVERWIALRGSRLGGQGFLRQVAETAAAQGPARALALCGPEAPLLGRILGVGLEQAAAPASERDRLVGDLASSELKRLQASLRPLQVVWSIAPLLGLLGTVWGMIEAFGRIADSSGLGRPEQLAGGITQALVTTAAGLTVAIPAIVGHHGLRARIERFARRIEDGQRLLERTLANPRPSPPAEVR
jgi:biopolymer transport protein ExbB